MLVNLLVNEKRLQLFIIVTFSFSSDPDRIQTYNLLIRSQVLYSVKLRGLLVLQNYTFFVIIQLERYFFMKNLFLVILKMLNDLTV